MTEKFIEDRIATLEAKADSHSTRLMNLRLQDHISLTEAWHDDHEKRLEIISKQITELEQLALKAQCNGHEYLSERVDNIEKHCEAMQSKIERLEARGHEYLIESIGNLIKRIAKLETGAVCDPIIIEDVSKQISTLQTAQIKTFSELSRLSERMDALSRSQCATRGDPGHGPFPVYMPNPTTIKIKGGWLNLYHTSPGKTVRAGALFSTRGEADAAAVGNDHRVACIHITDFTEGEGL